MPDRNRYRYSGFIATDTYDEATDILYLRPARSSRHSDEERPLAEILKDDIAGEWVSASYYVCNRRCSLPEAQKSLVRQLSGLVDATFGARYSEITGYLWTDEEVNIGGHDLIEELYAHAGKYLILIVTVESAPKDGSLQQFPRYQRR